VGPIHIAVLNNNFDSVKLLIDLGVNLDLFDSDGKSALYYACLKKHAKIVKMLSDAGATVQVCKERLC
jgi:ankyrin repeat protein